MKVLHIAPTPFFSNRGCHIRIKNEIESVQAQGVDIILCTYHHGENIKGIDIRRSCTIPWYRKTAAGYSPFKFIADIFLFFLVVKTVWTERPCVIHGHLHEGALIGWCASVLLFWRKIYLIMDMQGSLTGELREYGVFSSFSLLLYVFGGIEKIIYRLPHIIVCSSLNSLFFLQRQCRIKDTKTYLLQDIVPDRFFQNQDKGSWQKLYAIPENKHVVIYTGSFLQGKGIENLLETMKLLLAKRKDIFFVLLGYPEGLVLKFVEKYGLESNCLVVGEVSYDDLAGWLSVADVAVEPKMGDSGEASGKILHYAASGLPVVCFDLVNNRDFLAGDAFFAEPGSIVGMAAAIELSLADPAKASQKAGRSREKVRAEYSAHSVGRKLDDLYAMSSQ